MVSWMTNSALHTTTVPVVSARPRVEARMCAVVGGFGLPAGRKVPRSQEASVYPRRR